MGKTILFDLDGTLTDSGEGIINCVSLTLQHYGIALPPRDQLRVFVGPPLHKTFADFGIPKDQLNEAVIYYRKYYNIDGKFQNYPYPGMIDLLIKLKQEGHKLYVATSKPEHTSKEILEKFDMTQYFEAIVGSIADGDHDSKADVIRRALEKAEQKEAVIMVGDTVFDVEGANAHNIPTVAVGWGFGSIDNMIAAGAKTVVYTMDELHNALNA